MQETVRDAGLIPESGRSSGRGHSKPFQYCLENPMDRGAWWATVHSVAKRQPWLKWLSTHMGIQGREETCSDTELYCFFSRSLGKNIVWYNKYTGKVKKKKNCFYCSPLKLLCYACNKNAEKIKSHYLLQTLHLIHKCIVFSLALCS